jgi:chemotaxis protein methyltransferase WspC
VTATERILESLTRQIGLDPASLGVSAVTATIQERMRVLDLVDPESYRAKLASDPREWQNLTERLVVPETWFFRGPGLFDYLARTIRDAVQADPTRTVRILSIPCSTGEEPYSLAIALHERRVPP